MCCFWVEAYKSHLPFPVPPRTVKFQKDRPASCVSKWGQCRAEPPAEADGMQHAQERSLCCFCHWDFWSCLLLQQNLGYPNLPEVKTIWIQDSNSGLRILRPMLLVALYRYPYCLLLIRHPVDCNFFRGKLTFLLLLSLTWNKINFFLLTDAGRKFSEQRSMEGN